MIPTQTQQHAQAQRPHLHCRYPKQPLFQLLLLHVVVFSLLAFLECVDAFVPPKPGSDLERTYEPVRAYRERMGISYNYTPKLLNDEMCRYITEDECQRADEEMQAHATSHRQIQKQFYQERLRQRRRQRKLQKQQQDGLRGNSIPISEEDRHEFQELLGAFTKAYGSGPGNQPTLEEEMAELEQLLIEFNTTKEEHYRRQRERKLQPSVRSNHEFNPPVGRFVVPLFLMRFSDHTGRELPAHWEYQILWNLRIKKWIQENSYGRYDAFFDVQEWQTTDNTEIHYSKNSNGQAVSGRVSEFQKSFQPLLERMDERLNGDWSLYDVNGDGFLDNLIIIHSGYGAEEGGEDCINDRPVENRIWSHAFSNSNGGWISSTGQYKVRGYMIAAGLDLRCGEDAAKMGVMTHEYLHTFYLIDLYDLNFAGKGIGNFDIMAYPYGVKNDGYIPAHLSVWAKMNNEWLTCETITQAGTFTVQPAALAESCYKVILVDFNPAQPEYILFENRQQYSFDVNFWRSGLVMYHIDEGAEDQKWRGYPGDGDFPDSGDHYRVAVIQADREYHLERGNNIGQGEDVWQAGMKLTPNLDGNTWPNTDGYQFGYTERTGITIEVLEQEGANARFKLDFGTRSGSGGTTFSAPMREENRDPELAEIAENQLVAPDDPENAISGKIPQLGWFDRFEDAVAQENAAENDNEEEEEGEPEPQSAQQQEGLASAEEENSYRFPDDTTLHVPTASSGLSYTSEGWESATMLLIAMVYCMIAG